MSRKTIPAAVAVLLAAVSAHAAPQAAAPPAAPAARPARTAAPKPAAAPAPTVSVVGVRVMSGNFRAGSSEPGTRVAVALQVPAPAGIVAIDTDQSTLDSMQDSAGQVLEGAEFGYGTNVTHDGRAGIVELRSTSVPASRATMVEVKGSLAVTVATGSRTARVPVVLLKKGGTFPLAGAVVTLNDVTKDDEETRVELKGPTATMRAIKEIRFSQRAKTVESRPYTSSFSEKQSEVTYAVKTKGGTVALEVDLWQNPQQVRVPLDVHAALGVAR